MLQYESESNHFFTEYTFCLPITTVYQPFSEDWGLLCSAVKLAAASQEATSTFASQVTAQSCKDTHRAHNNITYMSRVSVYLSLR